MSRPLFKTRDKALLRQGPAAILVALMVAAVWVPVLLAPNAFHGVIWQAASVMALSLGLSIGMLASKRFRRFALDPSCPEDRWRRFARVQLAFTGIAAMLLVAHGSI